MLFLIVVGALVAVAVILLAPKLLPRRGLIALGLVLVALGAAAVAVVEWRYAPANTLLVQMPVALDRAGTVRTPVFVAGLSAPYDIWLEFDRRQEGGDFACLTGDPGAEAVCPRRDPALAVAWTVSKDAADAMRGATDWSAWHAKQAALDPGDAARRRKAYEAYKARSLDPSNNWPLYYRLATIAAEAGHGYAVVLTVKKPAGALAALHPRLAVGLGGGATKGLGAMALVFCLLCVVTGSGLLLRTIPRGKPAAPA